MRRADAAEGKRCVFRVIGAGDRYAIHPYQCSRKAVRGAYCGQHATKVERLNAQNARFDMAPFDPNHPVPSREA